MEFANKEMSLESKQATWFVRVARVLGRGRSLSFSLRAEVRWEPVSERISCNSPERSTLKHGFQMQDWLVLPSLNRLEGNGQEVHLEPKVMEVLVYLIESEGKVVSKEEVIGRVWPQVFVTDDVLIRSIGLLRKALDDDPKNPQFIETIPKSGYRLLVRACPVSAGPGF